MNKEFSTGCEKKKVGGVDEYSLGVWLRISCECDDRMKFPLLENARTTIELPTGTGTVCLIICVLCFNSCRNPSPASTNFPARLVPKITPRSLFMTDTRFTSAKVLFRQEQ